MAQTKELTGLKWHRFRAVSFCSTESIEERQKSPSGEQEAKQRASREGEFCIFSVDSEEQKETDRSLEVPRTLNILATRNKKNHFVTFSVFWN